ncbi:hypothetical protein HKX48_005698 [Thoreauomyces humboldtii]|nr:hypothetical protein HKX48_005698 [Thoreauomyces humboldtii]
MESLIDAKATNQVLWTPVTPLASTLAEAAGGPPAQAKVAKWGTPFRISWRSTKPVNFTSVRKVRNAWNFNKPVKISRDGVELDPVSAASLMEEFRLASWTSQSPSPSVSACRTTQEAKLPSGTPRNDRKPPVPIKPSSILSSLQSRK